MNYCLNTICNNPKNPNSALICESCGDKLLLRGCYQILSVLGKGGFGTTFAARNLSLTENSLCVIKQLRTMNKEPQVVEMAQLMFEREAKILGTVLRHPQVPKLLDYFEENERFYLVQEYIKGHNLHREVRVNGCFSETGVKQFLSEILPILKYLHQKKILHRDIKPANLIRRSDDCQLVLIDFGAVKDEVSSIFIDSAVDSNDLTAFAVGTAGFAPPEQLARRPVFASDIYALGVTCVYLLTGKTPKQLDLDPLTGELYWQEHVTVSEDFACVLRKMLALSLSDRYQSVEQVLEALQMLPYEDSMKQSMTTIVKPSQKRNRRNRENRLANFSLYSNLRGNSALSFSKNDIDIAADFPEDIVYPYSISSSANPRNSYNLAVEENFQDSQQYPTQGKDIRTATVKLKKQKLSAKDLVEAYHQGQRDFAGQALANLSLPKVRLPSINLYDADLTQANLQLSNLSQANLGRICLHGAILKAANLSGAFLAYANLEGADLRGANLSNANLKFANLIGANLCGANLLGAQVTRAQLAEAKTNWFTILPKGKRKL
jgi:serine/threonine-protein kinase